MSRSSDFAVRFTLGWARTYTRRLPSEVSEARIAEIRSDLWEQGREMDDAGVTAFDASVHVLARCLLGMPADLAWRRTQSKVRRKGERTMKLSLKNDWWLVPASAVVALWVLLLVNQLTDTAIVFDFEHEPRLHVRLIAGALWALFALAVVVGIALRSRRPQRAAVLIAIGAFPMLFGFWVPWIPPIAIAAIVGGIGNAVRAPVPAGAGTSA